MREQSAFRSFATVFRPAIVCCFVITLASLSIGDKQFELRKEILSHYNKSVSPGFEGSPSDVGIVLSITRVAQFNEDTGTLTVEAYLYINWVDTRLRWNDGLAYQNISWISVNSAHIWKPNMNVFNSARAQQYSNTERPVYCMSSGKVWWSLNAELHSACVPKDLRWFPLDVHTCKIRLGSLNPQDYFAVFMGGWNRSMLRGVKHEKERENPHWALLNLQYADNITSVSLEFFYPTEDFTFTIRRQGGPLLAIFLTLMVCCIFLSWFSFILPSRGKLLTKRLGIAIFSLYLSSVFLLALVKNVPGVGQRPPIIVKFYVCVIFLEIFTCLHTVIVTNILWKSSTLFVSFRKLPEPLQYLLGVHECGPPGSAKGLLAEEESLPDCRPEQLGRKSYQGDSCDLVAIACDRVHLFLQIIVLIIVSVFLCVL